MRSVIRVHSIGCALSMMALAAFNAGCGNDEVEEDPTRDLSYFPLSLNNYWTYAIYVTEDIEALDTVTVRIDSLVQLPGVNYYRLNGAPLSPIWITQDPDGNFYWTEEPGHSIHPFLITDARVDAEWESALGPCQRSKIVDADSVVDTPKGRFMKSQVVQLQCDIMDGGLFVGVARGTGPVLWATRGEGRSTWLLVETIALDDYSTLARPDQPQPGPTGP